MQPSRPQNRPRPSFTQIVRTIRKVIIYAGFAAVGIMYVVSQLRSCQMPW
jgi:hypothetical protein